MAEHEILTVPEAAERLRLSQDRIRQLIRDGILPTAQVVRPRGKHLIHAADVERLLDTSR